MRECSSYIHLYVQMGYKNSLGAKCQHCVFGLGVEGDGFFILNKDCVVTGRWKKKKKKKEEETCFKCMACNVCCSASLQLQHLLFQVERKNIQALECVKKKKKKFRGKAPICTEGVSLNGEWKDVYSSSVFILGSHCHLYALKEIADNMNLWNS